MSDHCPKCGSDIDYESHPATVRSGRCETCEQSYSFLETQEPVELPTGSHHRTLTLDEGAHPEAAEAEDDAASDDDAEGTSDDEEEATINCPTCGSPLELSIGAENSIEANCAQCNTVQRFVLEGSDRPPRRSEGGPSPPWQRGRGGPPGGPAARPCRECGGTLTFTTLPDGQVQGECAQCGNRFVLPPRRDRPGGGGRGGGGGYRGGSGYRPRAGGDRRYPKGGGGGGRGGYRGKRYERREGGDERPRRRSRDDE